MDEVNVLVMEDDRQAAGLLEETLTAAGYKVWVVDRPQRGLELAREMTFAAVVTELRFAGMNGVEAVKAIGKVSPETSVVVLTPYAFIASAVEAMEAGAYGYATKPLNPAEVRMVVQRAVERFSLLTSSGERRRFAELAVTDGLTGLYNHRYFKLCLSQRLVDIKAHAEHFSLLLADLDDFKQYNDTHGHPAGDDLLRALSQVLAKAARQEDLVFRYGGEEFVVLLDHADKRSATLVADRLRLLVNLHTPTTVSIGVSTCPEDGTDAQALIATADAALYRAKAEGKNRICVA